MNQDFNINTPPEENYSQGGASQEKTENETAYKPDFRQFYGGLSFEEYTEKQEIKRSCRTVGLIFIVSWGVMVLMNILISLAATILSSFSSENIMNEPAILQVLQIVFSMLVFVLPFVLVAKLSSHRISDLVPLGKCKKGTALPLFFFGTAFCSFANIATNYAASFFSSMGIDYEVDFGDNPEGVFGFLLTLISTVAVPALVEEFSLRGITLGILKKHGESFAIIASSIVFGLMHRNFQQMPFAFLVGLILGYITVKSGTLWIAVGVHAFNNLVSVILDYAGKYITLTEQNVIYTVFLVVMLILGLCAMLFNKENKDLYKLSEDNTIATNSKKIKWFMLTAAIIVYTVICVLESCIYFFV